MARIRNPRYAPEFLERRLSPSVIGAVPTPTAEVSTMRTSSDRPLPTDQNGDPIPDPTSDPEPGGPGPA